MCRIEPETSFKKEKVHAIALFCLQKPGIHETKIPNNNNNQKPLKVLVLEVYPNLNSPHILDMYAITINLPLKSQLLNS